MRKIFRLKGLDCANCAAKIERSVSKISGVENASVNFITQKLSFDIQDKNAETVNSQIEAAIKKIDADITLMKA